MGRPSLIKPAIVHVLSITEKPLRFTELKQKVSVQMNRKSLDDKQFNVNLKKLVDDGRVERMFLDEKVVYALSSGHFEQQLKLSLVKFINERRLSQLYDRLEGDELPPFVVFLDPPAYDYATKKPLSGEAKNDSFSFGGGPMRTPGEFRIMPNWSNPIQSIASVMLNDFFGLFSGAERDGIIKLVRWAYWLGCRTYIESKEILGSDLQELIDKNRAFALKCIRKFRDDVNRVEVEKALLEILRITEGLIRKENLAEFLAYIQEKGEQYRRLHSLILSREGLLGGGERIFAHFQEFGSMVASGLAEAGLLRGDQPLDRMPLHERFFVTTSKVWDEFFHETLYGFRLLAENPKTNRELREIKGKPVEALSAVRDLRLSLPSLLELPFKRRMVLIYLWGFPESVLLSNKSVVRSVDDWLNALSRGQLDHRVWLFKEQTLIRLEKAYRAVRQRREPLDIRIDKEEWSLRDIYRYHPYGRDPGFWSRLIEEIKTRASVQREVYRGGPVPKEIYEQFKIKETEAVEKMLSDEEEQAQKR